jgi:hypothetical protein
MQKFKLPGICFLVITHIGPWQKRERERERERKHIFREKPSFVPGRAKIEESEKYNE